MSLTEEKITLEQMPQLFVELKGEILGIKEMIVALGGSSGNRRWGWGQIGCESEATFADSVSHTFFHYSLALLRRLCRRKGA